MRYARILAILSILSLVVWTAYSDDVAELRQGGQAAVDELHAQVPKASPADRAALEARLDRVCGQKDCAASRLFWFTDLEEAKVAAQRLHRPILALHLLGRLDEELSCANSRLFRTLLYSDDSISSVLRDQYVLYWHSVRPVPRVTIEMGDGRVIRQTITGNSAHYLLDENGDVLDVLPGLYSPAAFRTQLQRWTELHRSLANANVATRREIVRGYHASLLAVAVPMARGRITVAKSLEPLELDTSKMNKSTIEALKRAQRRRPTAIDASKMVMTKTAIERPMLAQLQRPTAVPVVDLQPLSEWIAIGEAKKDEVQFSDAAIELIRTKQFGTEPVAPEAMRDLLDNLRRNVAADTALNEQTMRPRIHAWFANGEVTDLTSLNDRVYRDLFLTPNDDPWLGLQPPTVFTGIGGGS